jgi:Holliday junction resolvase
MSSAYERELKGILEGDEHVLTKITHSCSKEETDNYRRIQTKPFIVVRAAGSLGVDLVALRGDVSFLIEVKSSLEPTLHFSSVNGKLQTQAETMRLDCEKTKTLPIYAYRYKGFRGDTWRIFTFDLPTLEGRAQILNKRLPKLQTSKQGNYIMRWDDGLPCSEFISYLCR